jgi:hypothetical protein
MSASTTAPMVPGLRTDAPNEAFGTVLRVDHQIADIRVAPRDGYRTALVSGSR